MVQSTYRYTGARNAPRHLQKPETMGQAREFDRTASRYRKAGLDVACAAQAAYGHQCGFSYVHPPCDGCRELIKDFPVAKPNGWRVHSRGRMPG